MCIKRLVLIISSIVFSFNVFATTGKSLFVTFTDNTIVEFALSSLPEITVADNKMNIKTTTSTFSYPLQSVNTLTYAATTAIQNITSEDFQRQGNYIIYSGSNHNWRIFSLSGQQADVVPKVLVNHMIFNLDTLPSGIYVLYIDGKSLKFLKK